MVLIRGPRACLEIPDVWPSMKSSKTKPKVMYAWLEPRKDCTEATVHRDLSTVAKFEAPRPVMRLTRLALRPLRLGLRLLRPGLRLLRPNLRPLRPDLKPLRPGLRHLRHINARTHRQRYKFPLSLRKNIPPVPYGAAAQLSTETSYISTSWNSVMQYLLRISKEGILLPLLFLESSLFLHLLHYYMDSVFTHNPWGLLEIKFTINTLFL